MKQFCMKIDLISQRRENILFLPSNMAAVTSHKNALFLERWHIKGVVSATLLFMFTSGDTVN